MEERKYNAEYHLFKIIGLNFEIQKHVDALKELGVELYDSDRIISVKKGIEKFGFPLRIRGKFAQFNCCGTEVFQDIERERLGEGEEL